MTRYCITLILFGFLAGCGAETASTAATAGAAKAREAEEAKNTQERFEQKLEAANQQAAERLQAMERNQQ